MASRTSVLTLYRQILRESKSVADYNFREYALRRVREEVREASTISGADAITLAYQQGRQQLLMVRRQASISSMFPQDKHAME